MAPIRCLALVLLLPSFARAADSVKVKPRAGSSRSAMAGAGSFRVAPDAAAGASLGLSDPSLRIAPLPDLTAAGAKLSAGQAAAGVEQGAQEDAAPGQPGGAPVIKEFQFQVQDVRRQMARQERSPQAGASMGLWGAIQRMFSGGRKREDTVKDPSASESMAESAAGAAEGRTASGNPVYARTAKELSMGAEPDPAAYRWYAKALADSPADTALKATAVQEARRTVAFAKAALPGLVQQALDDPDARPKAESWLDALVGWNKAFSSSAEKPFITGLDTTRDSLGLIATVRAALDPISGKAAASERVSAVRLASEKVAFADGSAAGTRGVVETIRDNLAALFNLSGARAPAAAESALEASDVAGERSLASQFSMKTAQERGVFEGFWLSARAFYGGLRETLRSMLESAGVWRLLQRWKLVRGDGPAGMAIERPAALSPI